MKEIVILRVKFFNESIKQIAKEVASKFPGVTKVVEVEGECQLEVRGEFSISGLTKKLKKIDASVETNKIVSDGVTEPEIKIQPRDEGKRPIKIQKASKPLNDGASSSNGTASQNYGSLMWEQAKGVGAGAAEQAKAIGVGAAEKAKAIGAEAFNLLPNNMKWNYAKKNDRKENMAVVLHCEEEEMKEKKIRQEKEKEKKRIALAEEEMKQKKIKQEKEEERKKQALADEMKRQKKMKEEGKRRKQALAEEEEKQKKIKQEREDEKRRRQALENNSGACIIL
ncbi:Uncharacterized protein Rs2_33822 [Raphanus sativus]|nr:Uncharacterized protein Rs2_33822 [Raphanus sativus]